MNRKVLIVLISVLISFMLKAQEEEGRTKSFTWGLSGGANYSLLDIDSINGQGVTQPFLGFHFGYQPSEKIRSYAVLQLSTRAADNLDPVYKYRNQFADIKLIGQYRMIKGVHLLGGLQYSALLDSYYQTGGYTYLSNLFRYPTYGFSSQVEILAGISFEPVRDIQITFEYTIPFNYLDHSNFQAGLRIDLARFSHHKKAKKYTSLNEALKNPTSVEKLILHRQELDSLPPSIGQMTNLQHLVLDGNNLQTLPEEIGNLKKLKYLSVKFNELQTLPKSIGSLESLMELDLDHNELELIPESIGELQNLQYLTIGKNRLKRLPFRLVECTRLVELDVANSGNMLEIPMGLENLTQLEVLRIDQSARMPFNPRHSNPRLKVIVE